MVPSRLICFNLEAKARSSSEERGGAVVACTGPPRGRLDAERRAGSSRRRRRRGLLEADAVRLHEDHVVGGVHGRVQPAVGGRVAGELDRQPRRGWEP